MKVLVDVNLSPSWIPYFARHSIEAVHWGDVGDPRAPDTELVAWAVENDHVIFTHDLDFSRILALTQATGPSLFQVRTQDVLPASVGELVVATLHQHRDSLERGALIVLDAATLRARLLPL